MLKRRLMSFYFSATLALAAALAQAQEDEGDLARQTQNPVSDLISLPFQNNTDFGVGSDDDTRNVLNIQPVWPFAMTTEWNLITRTIAPLISLPEVVPGDGRTFGLGDISFTAFVSPAKPSKLIWGVGPVLSLRTATDDLLGTGKWGLGPSAVGLRMDGAWVYGALFNNIWSFAGDDDKPDINTMLVQPFINYNLANGWYVVSAPIITANWEADSNDRWTVPIGAGAGRVFSIGRQPINTSVQGYYNAEKPETAGAEWQLRVQVQLLFPR